MRHIQQGAQTLYDALTQGGENAAKVTALNTAGDRILQNYNASRNINEDIGIDNELRHIVGQDNLLFTNGGNLDGRLRMQLVDTRINASIGGRVSAAESETSHRAFLADLLGAAVPDQHKPKLEAIVGRTQDTWSERARAIKELVLHIQASEPGSIEALPDAVHVDKWYNKNYQHYDAKIKAAAASSAESGASSSDAAKMSMPIGGSVPTGYRAAPTGQTLFEIIGCHHAVPGAANTTREDRMAMRAVDTADSGRGFARNNLKKHVDAILASSTSATMKVLGIAFICTKFNVKRFIELAQRHIYVPIGLMLLRIHCTYKTLTGIKVASGGRAGYTVFGHSDVQIAHDAARKVGIAHYTTYLSAVVTDPKKVYIVQDMFCERYLGKNNFFIF